ncbi:MAG: hypothetical protein LCH51_14535 [Bacteroidetes bacterium]|nr:hypothetical protein [Bacteroidota bacterium]
MTENQVIELWQATNAKLENSLPISRRNIEEVTKMKVQTLLSSMKPVKVFAVIAGIVWVVFGSIFVGKLFIDGFGKISPWLLFSSALQVLLTAIALLLYIYQTVHIYQADISDSIVETQKKLTTLQSSSLWIARVLFLQLPLWTTFYWNKEMMQNGRTGWWVFQIAITLLFAGISIWLFFNINYKNKDKKWFKFILSDKEWKPVLKAIELNKEIADFKENN